MPSADGSLHSDLDYGATVRFSLQCDYPEGFGPDKCGAFFGDVELGAITHDDKFEGPAPRTAIVLPPAAYDKTGGKNQQYSPATSLIRPTVYPSAQSVPVAPTEEYSLPTSPAVFRCENKCVSPVQFDNSSSSCPSSGSSYTAERASFINEYTELNVDPDVARNGSGNVSSETEVPYGLPPDYVRLSVVLLLISPLCAAVSLYWAFKAKKHIQEGQKRMAWQLSHRIFYCLALGLFCSLIIVSSYCLAMLVNQYRSNHRPMEVDNTILQNSVQTNEEAYRRFDNSKKLTDREKGERGPHLDEIRANSKVPTSPNHSENFPPNKLRKDDLQDLQKRLQNSPDGLEPEERIFPSLTRSLSKRNKPEMGPVPLILASRGKILPTADVPVNGTGITGNGPEVGESVTSSMTFENVLPENVPNKKILTTTTTIATTTSTIATNATAETTVTSRSSSTLQSTASTRFNHFKFFLFNNKRQLEDKTTVHPMYARGIPIGTIKVPRAPLPTSTSTSSAARPADATPAPRKLRRRRNIHPRGRRRHAMLGT